MKATLKLAGLAACIVLLALPLTGCDPQPKLDSLSTNAPMDDQARAKMLEGMKKGAEDRAAQQAAWAKENEAKLADINAERAKMGRPPLATLPK